MNRTFIFLPLVGLTAFAGYLGFQRGQLPSETDIINRYVAAYLDSAPSGAAETDCAATPHPDEAVRMVINCLHPLGLTTTYFVGPRGAALPEPREPGA